MFKRILIASLISTFFLFGCTISGEIEIDTINNANDITLSVAEEPPDTETEILLSDSKITVNGKDISNDSASKVYASNDIIYYPSNKDASYGEGTDSDAHSAAEADAHTVIHITAPGSYRLKGIITDGQIFVDLGDTAKENPDAVVNLILDNADISCSVAPAIFFYNVYECSNNTSETATSNVDTSNAGANLFIAPESINTVNGAYVARIYKSGTNDTLHKYDGALYSRQSMNIGAEKNNSGVLHVNAENEGICSEMHLTFNGGNITVTSQNDGINTNNDGVSVTTINCGMLTINAGLGDEGDGIDSNGFIVINGGNIITSACASGADGGLDADRDILINGGTVISCGSQNGVVSKKSRQGFMNVSVKKPIEDGSEVEVIEDNRVLVRFTAIKNFSSLVVSSDEIENDKAYSIAVAGENIEYTASNGLFHGGMGNIPPSFENGEFPPHMRNDKFNIPAAPEVLDEWLKDAVIPKEIHEWIEAMKNFTGIIEGVTPRDNMPLPEV